jgi:hypothetical protein
VNRGEWEWAAVELSRRRNNKAKKYLKVRPFESMAELTEALSQNTFFGTQSRGMGLGFEGLG